jgi:hypothetical protein
VAEQEEEQEKDWLYPSGKAGWAMATVELVELRVAERTSGIEALPGD